MIGLAHVALVDVGAELPVLRRVARIARQTLRFVRCRVERAREAVVVDARSAQATVFDSFDQVSEHLQEVSGSLF